jgi:hypothetical protein
MSRTIKLSDLPALTFLDTVLQDIPFLREMDLLWKIDGGVIIGTMHDQDGLPNINRLHNEHGWKRDGQVSGSNPGTTDLRAWFERDGYEVVVTATRLASLGRPDGVTNYAIPFFAPPLPTIEELGTPAGKAAADAWMRHLEARDW